MDLAVNRVVEKGFLTIRDKTKRQETVSVNMSGLSQSIRTIATSAMACLCLTSVTYADDTEIFFSQSLTSEQKASNILFMFDVSGSMISDDGSGQARINSVKKAMLEVVDSGSGVRIGIGSFNGLSQGGNIHIPMIGVEEDRCPGKACGTVEVRGTINSSADDAREVDTGVVFADEEIMTLGLAVDSSTLVTKWFKETVSENDALEYPDGTFDLTGDTLKMFGDDPLNVPRVGIRFPNIDIPAGSEIVFADLSLQSSGPDDNSGVQSAKIQIESTKDSPAFADVDGQRISDRTLLTTSASWVNFYPKTTEDEFRYSLNLSGLVQTKLNRFDWASGDSITMVLDTLPGYSQTNAGNQTSWKSYDNGGQSRLKIEYSTAPATSQVIGLRYSDLNIPRGATVTSATLEFVSSGTDNKATSLNISAQDIGDAPEFSSASGDLSTRSKTASVNWTPGNWWGNKRWFSSSDVTSVVQSVVNRADWCGGNALAMFVEGTGQRKFFTHEHNSFYAPILKVNYDASSVAYGSSCVRKRSVTQLTNSINDAVEDSAGVLSVVDENLETHTAGAGNLLGFRFEDVVVPAGASVSSAYLRMTSSAETGDRPSVNITGELAPYSSTFDTSVANNLGSRTRTVADKDWVNIIDVGTGESIRSVDISDIVEEIVGQAGWVSGNPVTLLIAGDSVDTGVRGFESLDAGGEISLVVNFSMDGPDFAADKVPLLTGREDIINTIIDFRPQSGTPLVDAYFEAAAYMTGSAVDYGKTRGGGSDDEARFRVSAADTYTGGNVIRPDGCTDANLSDTVCAGEYIDGSPVYTQVDPGQCQANQIVLLTDGSATASSSEDRIKSMIGEASCADRDNGNETCGLELGAWLNGNDHFSSIEGVQPVVTHTVGFSFSSSFLEELAVQGGGGFYKADSSSELVDAFTKIIETAANTTTSFAPPSVAISQSNRLTNSNDLYFGLFKPENTVRWDGNLKKYSLAKDEDDDSKIIIVDGGGDPAFDPTTGTMVDTARSHWSTADDGSDIAAGGAASKMLFPRKVLTYVDATAVNPLIDLVETDTALAAALFDIDASQTDYLSDVIKWGRGVDIKDSDEDGDTSEVRLQMGDPLHSAPVIIDYATKSVVYIGTNEGFLHGFDTSDGTEEFAFIPKDLLSNLPAYFENPVDKNRPYGLDGPITSWINDTNGNNKVDTGESAFVVVGMRRGGRNYYALDVSDPASPELAWVIEGGVGDFTELGQSWSRPIKTKVRVGTTVKDVLIFSAGYDVANDGKTVRDTNDTMGRGIFIVDAASGDRLAYEAPITNTDLQYAIPSDIRAIDINLDSLVDYLFVGDMGGQLWRFDIDNDNSGSLDTALTGGVVADFAGSDSENYRRFFYEPDVALINGGSVGEYLNIAIGSGMRAHPLDTSAVDRLYVIRDRAVFGPPVNADGDISYAATKLTEANLFDATLVSGSTDTSNKIFNGWMIKLAEPGEKVLSKAVTINGQVLFTTYLPDLGDVGPCGVSLGKGRVYVVDAKYADPVSDLDGNGEAILSLADRYKNLGADGIPPHVSALIPEVSPDAPVVVVGSEVLPNIDFGDLFKRTFWAEN